MPFGDATNPVVVDSRGIDLIARAEGFSSPNVTFSLDSTTTGSFSLYATGPQTARFYSYSSSPATARIRVVSDALSSVATTVDLLMTNTGRDLSLVPQYDSASAIATGTRQNFALIEAMYSSGNARGVANTEWYLWTNGTYSPVNRPVNGVAAFDTAGAARVYARDPQSAQWLSVDVNVGTTTEPSVEVTPAVATVNRGGVVQFTAHVSTGVGVQWLVITGTGSVNSSGTYTAPQTAGIYIVEAVPVGGSGLRFGIATIVVQ
jgi:hypothetical protein